MEFLCSFFIFFGILVDRGSLGVCRAVGMLLLSKESNEYRIVEFATRGEAQNAIATLSNTNFMGRQIFIREVELSSLLLYGF